MLALALEGMGRRPRVLDPACGDGVFLARARAVRPEAVVRGVELDARWAQAAKVHGEVRRADFFALAPEEHDVVVGNPPYVRQERLGAEAKARIARRLREDWPELDEAASARLVGRADLAAAFVVRALRFVRPGGRVAFVLSQAALDAEYGAALRAFLRPRAALRALVASPSERWFPSARLHAAILVLDRFQDPTFQVPEISSVFRASATEGPKNAKILAPRSVAERSKSLGISVACGEGSWIVRLRVSVAEAAGRVRGREDLVRVGEVRVLGEEGFGERWGALLRAPQEWFEVARAAADWFVPLGDLAEVRRGATTGANEFFYMTRSEARARGIEPRFLAPVLRSPRHARVIEVDPRTLPFVAFLCGLDAAALARYPGAHRFIRAHASLAARPTLRARPRWWALDAARARVFLTKAYDTRFVQHISPAPIVADQRVYAVSPRRGVDEQLLAAVLNGTLTALALEALGRASMGEGALEWSVAEAATLPVLDVRRLSSARAAAVLDAFRALSRRPIDSVFDEMGRPDRRALDGALLAATPPALRELLPAAEAALVRAVTERIARSRRRL